MRRLLAPVGALTLALLIGAGALMARAKEPGAGQPGAANEKIGSIDMEQVYDAAGGPDELEQAAQQRQAQGADRINRILGVPYLEPNELQEYGTLIGKDKLTAEEQKRVDVLKKSSDNRAEELKGLETKPADQLKQADKDRIAHLNNARQVLQEQVRPGLVADFRAQQESWVAAYRHQQIVKLREDVGKVAKAKGIAHVFEANTLVYSVNDLTAEVMQRVGKRGNKHP